MRNTKTAIFTLILCLLAISNSQDSGACPTGFTGPKCALCTDDAACVSSTGKEGATCSQAFEFQEKSKVKSLACNPTAPALLLGLIKPDSLLIQCYTMPGGSPSSPTPAPTPSPVPSPALAIPSPSPVPQSPVPAPAPTPSVIVNGTDITDLLNNAGEALAGRRRLFQSSSANPYCEIGFQIENPAVRVECTANDCSISPGSSEIQCTTTKCACEGDGTCAGNSLVSSLATAVNGKAAVTCQQAAPGSTTPCTLTLTGLPVNEIQADCKAAECILPDDDNNFNGSNSTDNNAGNQTTTKTSSSPNLNPLIAAIPLILLTLIVGFVGTYTYMNRGMWAVPPAAAAGAAGASAVAFKASKKIDTLEFKNLQVQVPMKADAIEKKRAAMHAKALATHSNSQALEASVPVLASAGTTTHQSPFVNMLPKNLTTKLGLSRDDGFEGLTPDEIAMARVNSESRELNAAADYVTGLHGDAKGGAWTVIKDCNGVASGGEVCGVLGPSGCGKTTLLGAIAGSALDLGSSTVLEGAVLIDGKPRRGHQVAYVPQADNLIPTLTVAECIRYSALLRLPRDTPVEEVHARVAAVMEELGLRHIADSQVGGAGRIRGISGGERRRVTIGMELVIDPSIIVLDEPTSGLDSYTAINLIRSLRTVAASGRVVIASLHQPSKDMFYALDQVILMGHGRMVFAGRPEEAEAAFAAAGVPCPKDTAMAEHMLKVANDSTDIMAMLQYKEKQQSVNASSPAVLAIQGSEDGSVLGNGQTGTKPSTDFSKRVSNDTTATTDSAAGEMEAASPPGSKGLGVATTGAAASSLRGAGFARQLSVMFWRTFIDIRRNPSLLMLHVLVAAAVGIVIGAIFFDLAYDFSGVQNRMGGTFFALAFLAFTSLTTIDLLMNERNVVMREVRSGYYKPAAYLTSKLALDGMMLRVIPAVLLWAPFYYMAGFRTGSIYAATYVFALISFNCCVGALAMAVTIGSNTAGQAAFILNFTLLFALAFTGFLVKISSIPAFLRWIHFLSPFFYAFESMLSSELNGQKFTFVYQLTPDSPSLEIPNILGEAFITSLGLNSQTITRDLGILVALYAGFVLLAMFLFWVKSPRQKKSHSGSKVAAVAAGK